MRTIPPRRPSSSSDSTSASSACSARQPPLPQPHSSPSSRPNRPVPLPSLAASRPSMDQVAPRHSTMPNSIRLINRSLNSWHSSSCVPNISTGPPTRPSSSSRVNNRGRDSSRGGSPSTRQASRWWGRPGSSSLIQRKVSNLMPVGFAWLSNHVNYDKAKCKICKFTPQFWCGAVGKNSKLDCKFTVKSLCNCKFTTGNCKFAFIYYRAL